MMRQGLKILLLSLSPAVMFLAGCESHHPNTQGWPTPLLEHSTGTLDFLHRDGSIKASISIEIANTREAQIKGLMGRSDLGINHGMLFVFKQTKIRKFWMKNTSVPLDIIFVGEGGCIVNIAESTTPMSGKDYWSSGPIKYVVEVRAGFSKRFKIDTSTCIRWRRL
jgi:uncharacterized membrane protein (UPF0127 family)